MELLATGGTLRVGGKTVKMGLFFCSPCESEVIRGIRDGLRGLSCGCSRTIGRVTHGATRGGTPHPLLSVWNGMKDRCRNKNHGSFHRYGGRGIVVCAEWQDSFPAFLGWAVANGWRGGLEVDRIENDGNYEPSNCRVVTHAINSCNRPGLKLSREIAVEMRARYASGGINKRELGELYGVTDATAGKVINCKIYQ